MAQVWSRRSAGLVLLVQLALSVLSVEEDGGAACPHYPVDRTWKNSMSSHEKSFIKSSKKSQLYMEGSFKHVGAKTLFRKQHTAPNAMEGVKMAVTKAKPSDARGVYDVSVILSLELRPPRTSQDYSLFDDSGNLFRARGVSEGVAIVGDGTYDEATGELCVLGCILFVCKYRLRLKYPAPKTIVDVTVRGTLTSTGGATEKTFFNAISIIGFSASPITPTMNTRLTSVCPTVAPDVQDGKLWNVGNADDGVFSELGPLIQGPMVVTWNRDCEGANCSPFANLEYAVGGNKSFLRARLTQGSVSDGDELQANFLFSSSYPYFDSRIVDPTVTDGALLAEGVWNSEIGQLCMIACRLYGKQDCEIAITAQLPLTYTVTQRVAVVGHIHSLRNESDPAYFKKINFRTVRPESAMWVTGISELYDESTSYAKSKNQPEYVYTKVETARAQCAYSTEKQKKKKPGSGSYTSGEDWQEMEFFGIKDLPSHESSVENIYGVPIRMNMFTRGTKFISNEFHQMQRNGANVTGIGVTAPAGVDALQDGIVNVSYSLQYPIGQERAQDGRGMRLSQEFEDNMAGEGIYDSNTGKLCLVGCRAVDLKRDDLQLLEGDPPKDCQTFFSIQLPPIGSNKALTGTVKSLRDPKDPLYFQPESFSGNLFGQAADTLWRIDVEIVLSVLMLSLTVLCLIRQVQYNKRHPESLPYVSLSMVLVLFLAHIIPLVLDSEQLVRKKHRLMESVGGWPEVNKVVVRFVTMAAMLLQLRLLQLVWKSRAEARLTGKLAPAVHERRVLYYVVPLYVVGGLIAVLFHATLRFKPHERQPWRRSGQGGVWWGLQEYGGLVLDLHLLPQAMANVLWDATEQAPLSMPFYMGMAAVRSVPHVYDLCRQLRFVAASSSWEVYEYANPEWDFYSGSSDVLIPGGVVLLAAVVWLQQRWGGRCVLPRRWRSRLEQVEYERVEDSFAGFAL